MMRRYMFMVSMLLLVFASCRTQEQIRSFEECVEAGYPVMESYPRQCRDGQGNLFVENVTGSGIEAEHICTDEEKQAEACTFEYNPVCGDDGLTYGNGCAGCSSGNIDSYVPGECPDDEEENGTNTLTPTRDPWSVDCERGKYGIPGQDGPVCVDLRECESDSDCKYLDVGLLPPRYGSCVDGLCAASCGSGLVRPCFN